MNISEIAMVINEDVGFNNGMNLLEEKFEITPELVDKVAKEIGINFSVYDRDEFIKGLEVEQEHADITKNDPVITGKIAFAHMKEFKDYYTRHAKMEQEAKEELEKKAEESKEEKSEETPANICEICGSSIEPGMPGICANCARSLE